VVLLAYTTYTTLLKAKSQYDKENIAIANARKSVLLKAVDDDVEMSEHVGLLSSEGDDVEEEEGDFKNSAECVLTLPTRVIDELSELMEKEKKTPTDKVVILSVMVIVVVGLNMLKGGGGMSPIGVQCGSSSYWALTALILVWIIAISLWMRSELIEKWKLKRRVNYKFLAGDIEWNEKNTVIYPSLCFFAGFFAGMFGVGGGIVKGPLMLQMGVHPLVASGTTAVMIMFTSVAATTMFIAFGTLTWDYAWFLFVVGLITTTVGQFGVGYLVDKYKRYSYISMSIGAVVLISTVLMGLQSIFSLIEAQEGGGSAGTLCGKS
jgi:Sulfite exporter TauE/SafE